VFYHGKINDDKKLKSIIKKYGVQPLPGVDEVNFFKDDNTIVHFTRPEGRLILFMK
jgi:nascent polypeptide-associated complex subunit beta